MSDDRLEFFCGKVRGARRMCYGDVQRLRRDILPAGVRSRDEVDVLVGLHNQLWRTDEAWSEWLAAAIVGFALGCRGTGIVDEDLARWLAATLSGTNGRNRLARSVVRGIAEAATAFENDALRVLAGIVGGERRRLAGPPVDEADASAGEADEA